MVPGHLASTSEMSFKLVEERKRARERESKRVGNGHIRLVFVSSWYMDSDERGDPYLEASSSSPLMATSFQSNSPSSIIANTPNTFTGATSPVCIALEPISTTSMGSLSPKHFFFNVVEEVGQVVQKWEGKKWEGKQWEVSIIL